MSPSTPPTAVVICAYTERRWDDTLAAVESARTQTPPPVEVVVVVDHNDTLSERFVEQYAPGGPAGAGAPVRVVTNRHERGLSGARNTGVAEVSGRAEVVAFLDDDATARPGWLAGLAAAFGDTDVLVAGGPAVPVWQPERPEWFPGEFDWVIGCSYTGGPVGAGEIRNPLGCNMAVRVDAFERVHGFVDGIGRVGTVPLGCEETLFCISLRQAQPRARIVHVPESVVDHHVAADRHEFAYFRRRCLAEGYSKAEVAARVGSVDGLSSERGYVTATLPAAVWRAVVEAVRTRRLAPLARAGAVIVGLAITAAGYGSGRLRRARRQHAGRGAVSPPVAQPVA